MVEYEQYLSLMMTHLYLADIRAERKSWISPNQITATARSIGPWSCFWRLT